MKPLSIISRLGAGKGGFLAALAGLGALVYFSISPSLLQAVQVHVHEGQEVRLLLRNVLTTENVEKDDTIEFEVAEDVVVNGHTVIARGAPATGKVVRIKGAGKKKAKDASVTFRFVSVRTVDGTMMQLRKNPYKEKKKGEGAEGKENEIEEDQPIPGQIERVVGAERGKSYIAFLDQSASISVPETPTPPPPGPVTGQTQAPSQTITPPPAAPQEPATVDFASDPSGADIVIDGNFQGNTPSSLQVTAGRHTIELRLSGYRTYTVTMRVDPGSHPRISKALEKE
jgi:hypothetical protein